jgi:hypothetical protein
MAYPNSKTIFDIKINKNASGYALGPEYFNVPGSSPYEIYLDHVPKSSATTTIGASGGAAWTEVLVTPTAAGQYLVDYTTGKLTFHSANANNAAQATYQCLGDDIMAEHINVLQNELTAIEAELGDLPKQLYATVSDRLNALQSQINAKMASASGINGQWITDNTVRAGALMDDIKGASWSATRDVLTDISAHKTDVSDAHAASAISCTSPGSSTFTDVQAHINANGGAPQTDSNPHGMAFGDIGTGDIYTPGNITAGTNLKGRFTYGQYIFASGTQIYLNYLGPDADQYLCFYNNSNRTDKYLRWADAAGQFHLNSDLVVGGVITASGNIMPEASGTRTIGSVSSAFSQGNFGTVRADTGYITNLTVGAGTLTLGGLLLKEQGGVFTINGAEVGATAKYA